MADSFQHSLPTRANCSAGQLPKLVVLATVSRTVRASVDSCIGKGSKFPLASADAAAVNSNIGRSCLLTERPTVVGLIVINRKTRMPATRKEPGKRRRRSFTKSGQASGFTASLCQFTSGLTSSSPSACLCSCLCPGLCGLSCPSAPSLVRCFLSKGECERLLAHSRVSALGLLRCLLQPAEPAASSSDSASTFCSWLPFCLAPWLLLRSGPPSQVPLELAACSRLLLVKPLSLVLGISSELSSSPMPVEASLLQELLERWHRLLLLLLHSPAAEVLCLEPERPHAWAPGRVPSPSLHTSAIVCPGRLPPPSPPAKAR